LVARAQAPVWDISAKHHIERKKPTPYANHYSFHLVDLDWGHLTIKISGHPPFPAQVILNGHEYVACQARKAGVTFTKEGNCFTTISDVEYSRSLVFHVGGHMDQVFQALIDRSRAPLDLQTSRRSWDIGVARNIAGEQSGQPNGKSRSRDLRVI
jgi:hypothetical protein